MCLKTKSSVLAEHLLVVRSHELTILKELNIKFYWKGKGINSKCYDKKRLCIVECDKEYYRPLEVDSLLGDSRKAKKELNWKPNTNINHLVREMYQIIFRNHIVFHNT